MELTEAMRTTGTCRYFRPDPVPDDVLRAAFDVARFGPQGGNRQPVRWVVVREAATKQALADLYLPPWKAYLDAVGTGDVNVGALPRVVQDADYFAEHLASVPGDRRRVRGAGRAAPHRHGAGAAVGRRRRVDLPHRAELPARAARPGRRHARSPRCSASSEPKVRELLAIPDGFVTACHIAVGYPERPFPTKLTRSPVDEIVFAESFGTPLFS